ncbi:MAG: hypothetical protein A2270_07370 [Elusimicrobia bacterium RIFOXYA12_FULL_51_18]|nr:MAG: hypothetical protein A2270_07370 [Elusimicrobia bacterium RIFOXYA12_FULL_51_18]OGS28502.1 MAG: hypothetical protein A2218_05675 [Elusimicrobia bacterium RIFOXYA2_FULL_53_38]
MNTRKTRILQANKLYYPYIGGIETIVQQIAEGLAGKFAMEVLTCNTVFFNSKEVINDVAVTRLRAFNLKSLTTMPISLAYPFVFKERSSKYDVSLIHAPFPLGEMGALLANKNTKIVCWWHSDIIRQKKLLKVYKYIVNRYLERVDHIVVATPGHITSSIFLNKFKYKCSVIPYGVDITRFTLTPDLQSHIANLRIKHGPRIILFVGRLVYYKGCEYLLEAMKNVDAKLIVIGSGPLNGILQDTITHEGLRDKVETIPSVSEEDLRAYYHACDIFVLPSVENSEGFGIVQIEAMACKKPVINTSLPTGVPWVSVNGLTGFTVPPRDSESLANAINKLLMDSDLRLRFGENARNRVLEHFTLDKMLSSIGTLFSALGHKR